MTGTLSIGPGIDLPAIANTRNALIGQSGSGKSYAARSMVEHFIKHFPTIVIDPTGAWWGLRLRASGAAVSGSQIPIIGGTHGDIPLDPRQGAVYAKWIASSRCSAVLDLSKDLSRADGRRFVEAFLSTLYRLKGTDRSPLHIVIDEADEFAPQKPVAPEAVMSRAAVDQLVRRARIRGVGVTLITQRPAVLDKDVLNMSETLVFLKLTGPTDIKAVGEWIKYHGTPEQQREVLSSLSTLKVGDGWWWMTAQNALTRGRVHPIKTFDSMRAPDDEHEYHKTLGNFDAEGLTAEIAKLVEDAKANDPAALKAEVAKLRGEIEKLEKAKGAGPPTNTNAMADLSREVKHLRDQNTDLGRLAGHLEMEAIHWRNMAIEIGHATIDHAKKVKEISAATPPKRPKVPTPMKDTPPVDRPKDAGGGVTASAGARAPAAAKVSPEVRRPSPESNTPIPENLSERHASILRACLWWRKIGVDAPTIHQVAVMVGLKVTGSFETYIAKMRAEGLLETARGDGLVRMSEAGEKAVGPFDFEPVSLADFQKKILDRLDKSQVKIATALLHGVEREEGLTIEDLAACCGLKVTGSFETYIASLRKLGLLKSGTRGRAVLSDIWFPEGLS